GLAVRSTECQLRRPLRDLDRVYEFPGSAVDEHLSGCDVNIAQAVHCQPFSALFSEELQIRQRTVCTDIRGIRLLFLPIGNINTLAWNRARHAEGSQHVVHL